MAAPTHTRTYEHDVNQTHAHTMGRKAWPSIPGPPTQDYGADSDSDRV